MGRTQTGFPCFARTSCDRGGCPLYSGDSGAHPDRGRSTASICGLSTARSLNPATNIHPCEAPHDEASTKGSRVFTRPIFPSPGAPGWISSTLGFPPSFAPRDYSQRTSGTGQVIEHGPEPTLYLIDLASNHALISQCVRPRVARDDAEVSSYCLSCRCQRWSTARCRRRPGRWRRSGPSRARCVPAGSRRSCGAGYRTTIENRPTRYVPGVPGCDGPVPSWPDGPRLGW